jgi:hypothetical protein
LYSFLDFYKISKKLKSAFAEIVLKSIFNPNEDSRPLPSESTKLIQLLKLFLSKRPRNLDLKLNWEPIYMFVDSFIKPGKDKSLYIPKFSKRAMEVPLSTLLTALKKYYPDDSGCKVVEHFKQFWTYDRLHSAMHLKYLPYFLNTHRRILEQNYQPWFHHLFVLWHLQAGSYDVNMKVLKIFGSLAK